MIVYLNGQYLPKSEARLSVDERGFLFGDGVYELARAVRGDLFELERHLARVANGAAALDLCPPPPGEIVAIWNELLRVNDLHDGEAVTYLQVTRGAAPRAHQFPPAGTPATVYAYAIPHAPPDALRAEGAACVTYPDLRWGRCDLKTVNLLPNVMARQAAAAAGAFEAVLVRRGDDGTEVVTEGSLSSVFAVVGGALRTHPLGPRILPSVTRAVVLELAADLGVPVHERACTPDEVRAADELFMANTTSDVMPVVRLDGAAVGAGAPGPVTRALSDAMHRRMGR